MKITIFWLAGSGTSTIWKLLAQQLNSTFMSSGNILRSWAQESGYTIYEFEDKVVKQDHSFDQKLDKKVQEFGENNDDFIFESRLAWYFIPDSFKIYLYCDSSERYNRIQKREGGFLDEIIEKTQKREDDLVERYSEVYPEITFPPQDEKFDLKIDATSIMPDEIIEKILAAIKK